MSAFQSARWSTLAAVDAAFKIGSAEESMLLTHFRVQRVLARSAISGAAQLFGRA